MLSPVFPLFFISPTLAEMLGKLKKIRAQRSTSQNLLHWSMSVKNRILIFCLSSVLFISCDQVTKDLARTHLRDKPSVSLLSNTIKLEYAENTGAALGLGDDLPQTLSFWLLGIVPLVILLIAGWYVIRHAYKIPMFKMVCYALICSGGIGNIIDRLLHDRHVTDFMILGIGSIHTGIFNVADMCVTTGVAGLLVYSFQKKKTEFPS
jgi:signal peptidase II